MHSKNFLFWKMAFDKKLTDINTLSSMVNVNGELTADEFQLITGTTYVPVIADSVPYFIPVQGILTTVATEKVAGMKKDLTIKKLTQQMATDKISSMQKDQLIQKLTQQIASTKVELMKLKMEKVEK